VRAERPTSAKPGDKAIVTADGKLHGWIGGSCAQPTVIHEALEALRAGDSRFIRLSPNPLDQPKREGLSDVPMACFSGGTLEIYIEPQQPQPRLIVIGNLPVARSLGELGKVMGYRTIFVDPDHQGAPPPYADELLTNLSMIPEQVIGPTSIVVATHGQYDELALEQALRTSAPYIGLVASRKRAEAVREYLAHQGFPAEQVRRFKAPAGLDIQARRGDEIALSIMAEIVQRRRNSADLAWQPASVENTQPEVAPAPAAALDPVCGMSVTIAEAKYSYEYEGSTYYFCCPGCKTTFRKAPEQYISVGQTYIAVQ
jgi:xanthine dehydrogenase accessory factor